jgi:hypothetical protein
MFDAIRRYFALAKAKKEMEQYSDLRNSTNVPKYIEATVRRARLEEESGNHLEASGLYGSAAKALTAQRGSQQSGLFLSYQRLAEQAKKKAKFSKR